VIKGEVWRKKARKFLLESIESSFTLISPPIFEYEIESVLQHKVYSGIMTAPEVDNAITRLAIISVRIVTHINLVNRAREIARQFNQPAIYDSLYAALAELRNCEFWTADKAFYDAVKAKLAFVNYLPYYP